VAQFEDSCLLATTTREGNKGGAPQSISGLKQFYAHCVNSDSTPNTMATATAKAAKLAACGDAIRDFLKCAGSG
jgi:hypothetical protein